MTRFIRVWKDETVVGVVSSGWRFLQAPCRGTACTFDLAQPEDEEQNNRADGCADDGGYNP
jgi:hypothetical protein